VTRWRQFIAVRGDASRLLEGVSNITSSDLSNIVIIRGDGEYFPEFNGADWAAMCAPRGATDIALDDIRPILDLLISEAPLAATDAPREDIETFLRGVG
jgi:hypothetical protein